MPKEAQQIQFVLPGAPTLLELCQRLVSAARGVSDPLPDEEREASMDALRLASTHWVENDDPFDAGVLALVRTTLMRLTTDREERAVLYSATLDALSDQRDALCATMTVAPATVQAPSCAAHDRILLMFPTADSERDLNDLYRAEFGHGAYQRDKDFDARLDALVDSGDLVRFFRVHSPFDNHLGLADFATREEVPAFMDDDWRDPPSTFAVEWDDVHEVYKRAKT